MVVLEHLRSGERCEIDGELPFGASYVVEGYDEQAEELWQEERVDLDGETYIVVDDGIEMATVSSPKETRDSL